MIYIKKQHAILGRSKRGTRHKVEYGNTGSVGHVMARKGRVPGQVWNYTFSSSSYGMFAFISSMSSTATFAFESYEIINFNMEVIRVARNVYPKVVMHSGATFDHAKPYIAGILCEGTLHALEKRNIQEKSEHGFFAHDCTPISLRMRRM